MKTYVALLRGINLGAHNRISMPDLRALVGALGAEDATTYLQSGNVVFRSDATAATLSRTIERRIADDLGLDVAVLLRSADELARVVAGNPFLGGGREREKLHVTFLAEAPDRERLLRLDPERAAPDEFHVAGRDVYLHCPEGYGRSKLTNAYFEKQLAVAATTRNWKSVTKLAELAAA